MEYLEEKKEQSQRIINNSSSSTSLNIENFEHEYIRELQQKYLESSLSVMIEVGFRDIDTKEDDRNIEMGVYREKKKASSVLISKGCVN